MEIYENNLTERQKKDTHYKGANGKRPKGSRKPLVFIHDSYRNRSTPTWEKIVFFLMGLIGLNVISVIVTSILTNTTFYDPNSEALTPKGNALNRFLAYGILLGCFLLLICLDKHATYKKIFSDFRSWKPYVYGLCGFFGLILINIIFNAIYTATRPNIYGANDNQQSIESRRNASPALSIMTVVAFAPFCEEMTYRLGLLDAIGKKHRWLGLVISALIFGAIHFDSTPGFLRNLYKSKGERELYEKYRIRRINEWLNLPIYRLSGFILGLTYVSSGKMASSWISHRRLNGLSCIEVFAFASNRHAFPIVR